MDHKLPVVFFLVSQERVARVQYNIHLQDRCSLVDSQIDTRRDMACVSTIEAVNIIWPQFQDPEVT